MVVPSPPDAPARCRPEVAGDRDFLLRLFRATHGAGLAGLDLVLAQPLLALHCAGQAAGYRSAYPGARFAIVEAGGVPVGRIITDAGAAAITLVDLALLPEWQGRGLGTALVRAVLDEARAAGLPVHLSVPATNPGARRLYERLGFTVAARRAPFLTLECRPA